MENNIAPNIRTFGYSKDALQTVDKFSATMNLYSTKDLKMCLDFLESNGIVNFRPSTQKVFCLSFDEIKSRVNAMKDIHQLDCLVEDPGRLLLSDLPLRIAYMIENCKQYKKINGSKIKYLPDLFNGPSFERKYGRKYLDISLEEFIKTFYTKSEDIKKEEEVKETEDSVDDYLEEDYNNDEDINSINPIMHILNTKQSEPLEDVDRYDELNEITKEVLSRFVGNSAVPEEVAQDLVKLIANGIVEDTDIVFYSIGHGAKIDEKYLPTLKEIVEDVINRGKGGK